MNRDDRLPERVLDSIEHASIWRALRSQSVSEQYIKLLSQMYDGQTAPVMTAVENEKFEVWRGAKQGDPLSSPLVDTVFTVRSGKRCRGMETGRIWSETRRRRDMLHSNTYDSLATSC